MAMICSAIAFVLPMSSMMMASLGPVVWVEGGGSTGALIAGSGSGSRVGSAGKVVAGSGGALVSGVRAPTVFSG